MIEESFIASSTADNLQRTKEMLALNLSTAIERGRAFVSPPHRIFASFDDSIENRNSSIQMRTVVSNSDDERVFGDRSETYRPLH